MRMEDPSAVGVADLATGIAPISTAPEAGATEAPSFLPNSAGPENMGRMAAVGSPPNAGSLYSGRTLDVVVATLLLILVLPLMGLCALAVLGTSRGPILFRHPRIGRQGELFSCLKFRTMVQDADTAIEQVLAKSTETRQEWAALHKLKRDPRVTPGGAFLRRYCLDELPQLFNVLAGEMSIVGPRPIEAAEVERYGVNFAAYCSVKPGLTGLWQVSGRHLLSYSERVELDAQYARSKTLSLDLLILWRTVPIVLRGENH
jgi:exopolysaccharide production protein ExoY